MTLVLSDINDENSLASRQYEAARTAIWRVTRQTCCMLLSLKGHYSNPVEIKQQGLEQGGERQDSDWTVVLVEQFL